MTLTKTFNPIGPDNTGYIVKDYSGDPSTYEGLSDTYPLVARNTASFLVTGAFFNFQTGGSLPERAIITKVEFLQKIYNVDSGTPPLTYVVHVKIGKDIIQDGLESNEESIYENANWILGNILSGSDCYNDTDVDLYQEGIDVFNRNGDTDIALYDLSLYFFGCGFTISYYGDAGARSSQLKVTYEIAGIKDCKIFNATFYGGA